MSLYNMVHGESPIASVILAILGVTRDEIPRYRDTRYDGEHFIILTRTGGGNREEYEVDNLWLTTLDGYVSDQDADFDSTYAEFRYEVPADFSHLLEKLKTFIDTKSVDEKWMETFEALKNPSDPRTVRMVDQFSGIVKQIVGN